MQGLMMDTNMVPASIVMDRQLTAQQPSNAMAQPVAAAAGVSRISTPVSMMILDLVMLDHNSVRAMYEYDAYRSPAISLEHKQLLAWEMIMSLSAHAAKEELVVYPVVRSTLGAATTDKLTGDHQMVKNLLATLDTLGADHPSFDMQLRSSLDSMITHMQEEETTVLPQLSAVLDVESQLRLGILFEAAKVRAPTRPHPEILTTALPAPFFENQLAATKLVDASLDQARMPALTPTAVGLSPLASAAVISSALDSSAAGGGGGGGGDAFMTAAVPPPQSMGMPAVQQPGGGGFAVPPPASPATGGFEAQEVGGGGFGSDVGSGEFAPAAVSQDAGVMGLLADDAGPLGAGVDAEAVPYPAGLADAGMGQEGGMGFEGAGGSNLVPASQAGAAVVPDYTDVGVGGVPGVPTEEGGDTEMGAAGGMPGDLTAVINAPAPPAGAAGEVTGVGGGGGRVVSGGGVPSGGDFGDDIGGTNVEAVKDVGAVGGEQQQDLAPAGLVE